MYTCTFIHCTKLMPPGSICLDNKPLDSCGGGRQEHPLVAPGGIEDLGISVCVPGF